MVGAWGQVLTESPVSNECLWRILQVPATHSSHPERCRRQDMVVRADRTFSEWRTVGAVISSRFVDAKGIFTDTGVMHDDAVKPAAGEAFGVTTRMSGEIYIPDRDEKPPAGLCLPPRYKNLMFRQTANPPD